MGKNVFKVNMGALLKRGRLSKYVWKTNNKKRLTVKIGLKKCPQKSKNVRKRFFKI